MLQEETAWFRGLGLLFAGAHVPKVTACTRRTGCFVERGTGSTGSMPVGSEGMLIKKNGPRRPFCRAIRTECLESETRVIVRQRCNS